MKRTGSIARGMASAVLVIAYEAGAHHAVGTPGLEGLGLTLVLAPAAALALGTVLRSPRRFMLLPLVAAAAAGVWV